MKLFSLIFLAAVGASAQTHSVAMTWTASVDSTTGNPGTVTVLRAPGNCTGTPTFTVLTTTAPAAGPYTDNTVAPGTYCYEVEAVISGATSQPSNLLPAPVQPAAPTKFVIVVT